MPAVVALVFRACLLILDKGQSQLPVAANDLSHALVFLLADSDDRIGNDGGP